uniref:DUF4939 domain-containing protein n=1 Tax=Takifugu rubripes TaxID=31033 RepID=A0A674NR08_TAKRU
ILQPHTHSAQLASNAAEARETASALEQALRSVATQVQQLVVSVSQPAAPVPAPAPPPPVPAPPPGTAPEPRVGTPERYSGDPEGCNPFITNCSILFALQPYTFASEAAKVAFTINHLTGRARLWGTAEWERGTPACSSFQALSAELRKSGEAASQILSVHAPLGARNLSLHNFWWTPAQMTTSSAGTWPFKTLPEPRPVLGRNLRRHRLGYHRCLLERTVRYQSDAAACPREVLRSRW